MKKIVLILVIGLVLVVIGRAKWVEEKYPAQWSLIWENYQNSQSIGQLFKESYQSMMGERVRRTAMSQKEMNRVVYQWIDDRGEKHISYQRPEHVENVKEIRLGDLNYQVEKSLSEQEIKSLLGKASEDK